MKRFPESRFQHAQKVGDIRLSAEIYGKCENVHAAITFNDSLEFKKTNAMVIS